jgi:ribosome-binding protein aMBF1 (putative translation factor)
MRNLLDTSKIIEVHPDLEEQFHSVAAKLARVVFRARNEKGWNQLELGKRAGVAKEIICRVEGGSGGVSVECFEKVFHALGLRKDEIDKLLSDYKNKFK